MDKDTQVHYGYMQTLYYIPDMLIFTTDKKPKVGFRFHPTYKTLKMLKMKRSLLLLLLLLLHVFLH